MGLDFVELMMEAENRFGVSLEGVDWSNVWTVGDLANAIRSRLGEPADGCPSLAAFFALREAVRVACGDDELRVRPSERLADRLTGPQRRRLWKRLPDLIGCRPPGLNLAIGDLGTFGGWATLLGGLGMLAATGAAAVGAGGMWIVVPPALGLGAATTAFGLWAFPPLRTRPPWMWETFGQVARRVAARDRAAQREAAGGASPPYPGRGAVFAELREIIAESFSVPLDDITPQARLVEDLRLC